MTLDFVTCGKGFIMLLKFPLCRELIYLVLDCITILWLFMTNSKFAVILTITNIDPTQIAIAKIIYIPLYKKQIILALAPCS